MEYHTIVLAFALAAAGALAYLFSGGTAAWQRHERQPVAAVAVRPRETRDAAADAAPADELSWIAWAYAALASFPCCMPSSFSRTAQGHTGCSLPICYLCPAAVIAAPALAFMQRPAPNGAEAGL
jgi:hypothetical protein